MAFCKSSPPPLCPYCACRAITTANDLGVAPHPVPTHSFGAGGVIATVLPIVTEQLLGLVGGSWTLQAHAAAVVGIYSWP